MHAPARLAELLGSLSIATDLAAGLPRETALRTSLIAVRLAARAGLRGQALADVYYAGLFRFLGCSAYAHELACHYAAGDDLGLLRELTRADAGRPRTLLRAAMRGVRASAPLRARAGALAALATGPALERELAVSHCELALVLARQLGAQPGVLEALGQVYEQWGGGGFPKRLRGEAISLAARIIHVAWRLAAHLALDGPEAALHELAQRAGRQLDPALVRLACAEPDELLAERAQASVWQPFLAAEPAPRAYLEPQRSAHVASAFGHFADVKSPFTVGHSGEVAELAGRAAELAGLDAEARATLQNAALLHDLGRVAVMNAVWDKPGPLDRMERELAEAHASESERILSRSALTAPYAALAGMAHERLDAAGYHRRLPAAAIDQSARLLAAADVYAALTRDRPQRARLSAEQAARTLEDEARTGKLCTQAVHAVLAAAGRAPRREPLGDKLSERECEVLRQVARGLANKQIAAALHISPATVKRHLENLYEKTGLRSRAAVTVWALEQRYL